MSHFRKEQTHGEEQRTAQPRQSGLEPRYGSANRTGCIHVSFCLKHGCYEFVTAFAETGHTLLRQGMPAAHTCMGLPVAATRGAHTSSPSESCAGLMARSGPLQAERARASVILRCVLVHLRVPDSQPTESIHHDEFLCVPTKQQ